jgi:methionine synthase reductase
MQLNLDQLSSWPADAPVILVVSSTGNGDPPGNAEVFWRSFKKHTDPTGLAHVRFAMLGLGSSDYDSFQGFPNALYDQFVALGAKEFAARCKADDARGLDTFVEPWIADIWPDLEQFCDSYYKTGKHKEFAPVAPAASGTTVAAAATAPAAQAAAATPSSSSEASKSSRKKVTPAGVVPKPPPAVSRLDSSVSSSAGATEYLTAPKAAKFQTDAPLSRNNPFLARFKWARKITNPEAQKTVIFASLDASGVSSELPLLPGHAFGVLVPNPKHIVNTLLNRLTSSPDYINPDQQFKLVPIDPKNADQVPRHLGPHTGGVCTLREALTWWYDLTSLPSKRFLAVLGNACTDEDDKNFLLHLASTRGKDDYTLYFENKRLNLLETLLEFPSCKPSLAYLLDTLPPMQPRYFSVANSQLAHKDEIHFMFVVVDTPLPEDRRFKGVATNWMLNNLERHHLLPVGKDRTENLEKQMNDLSIIDALLPEPQPLYVPIFQRASEQSFAIAEDPQTPIIMVGPGTGVSPFIGFLQHRKAQKADGKSAGKSVLFYGCRHPDKDFLLRSELEHFVADGTLNQLVAAFSRYNADKVEYVQHRMEEETHGKEIVDLMMNHNGIIYVCGDARNMARGVRESIIKILQRQGGLAESAASELLSNWAKQKRYLLDVWA